MSPRLGRRQTLLAGLLVLLGLAGAGYGLFAVGDRQRLWHGSFNVHVGFDRVQGVGVGTPVRVRGLEAGAVAAVDLPTTGRPDAPLILRLQLDRRYAPMLFANATARILSEGMVGGKVVELEPGKPEFGPLADGAVIASKPTPDMNQVVEQAASLVEDLKSGRGPIAQEVTGALSQTKQLMEKSQEAASAIRQDADAIKRLPIIRGYVEDTTELLVRHTGERYRKVFADAELFEPGRAVLTEAGQAKLDELGPWLTQLRYTDSDVVVVAYADPSAGWSSQVAQTLTAKQSEVVANYLKDRQAAHKLGWWSRRKVATAAMGLKPPPVEEKAPLPPGRVEVIVFVP